MHKQYFAYIRVSTAKQGDKGVSLDEQRAAIERYCQRYGLPITRWFEERETAAKRGRKMFGQMMQILRRGQANGVVMHKIDRGARNLKDWAELADLADAGVEVHFANESLDLNTRGGRLSADIQAVVAADYIRNLREEAKKGIYGRLKQGIYPMSAPIGYQDRGAGKPKEPDPSMAPLVIKTFELYSTGNYSLPRLVVEMHDRGLRNRQGGKVSVNGLSTILNNPFYVGVIRIKKTRELFRGAHIPLVSKPLFDRVQAILDGKTVSRIARHEFIFRRMIRCAECGRTLIGEIQKGHIYYRCQTRTCPVKTFREERIDDAVAELFDRLATTVFEEEYIRDWLLSAQKRAGQLREQEVASCQLRLDHIRDRIARLTDVFIDGNIDKAIFEDRKATLILEEAGIKDQLRSLELNGSRTVERIEKFLELIKTASNLYKSVLPSEKRDFVKRLTSNLAATQENVVTEPLPAVLLIAERPKTPAGGPKRGVHRTWDRVLKKLVELFTQSPEIEYLADPN